MQSVCVCLLYPDLNSRQEKIGVGPMMQQVACIEPFPLYVYLTMILDEQEISSTRLSRVQPSSGRALLVESDKNLNLKFEEIDHIQSLSTQSRTSMRRL